MSSTDELTIAVIEGNNETAVELTKKALADGEAAKQILSERLLPAMEITGERFEKEEIWFPELLMAANAMKTAVDILRPELAKSGSAVIGKYLIGTVDGDAHDIGKNLVSMFLEQNGWEVTDLGVDVSKERFCEEINTGDYDIVGLSAMLTVTLPEMENVIEGLKEAGLRNKVKIMIGGAPVTQAYADQIGADAYAPDAASATARAKKLLG